MALKIQYGAESQKALNSIVIRNFGAEMNTVESAFQERRSGQASLQHSKVQAAFLSAFFDMRHRTSTIIVRYKHDLTAMHAPHTMYMYGTYMLVHGGPLCVHIMLTTHSVSGNPDRCACGFIVQYKGVTILS